MLLQRWEGKNAGKKSRLNRDSNSQTPGHESNTLTTEPPGRGSKISNSIGRNDNFLAKARKLSMLPTWPDIFDIRQHYIYVFSIYISNNIVGLSLIHMIRWLATEIMYWKYCGSQTRFLCLVVSPSLIKFSFLQRQTSFICPHLNLLLHRYSFWLIKNRQLLKKLWEKKKLLITSNLFFSHNAFYSIR